MLDQGFDDLKAAIADRAPEVVDRFNPGISEVELGLLEAQLLPYVLPKSLRALYRWHNGAEEPLELIPGYAFLSFEQALEEYRMQFELDQGTEGWNPLWFPILSFQGDHYCVILSAERRADAPVFLIYNQDTEVRLMFRDLGALIETAIAGFKSGAYQILEDYFEVEEDDFELLRSKLGDRAPLAHVDGQTSFSRFFTQNWPEEWRQAIGRTKEDYELTGADCTIAKYLRNPRKARLNLRIRGLMGSAEWSVIDVEDASGEMTLFCPRDARGARELQISRNYEMEIEPGQASSFSVEGCVGIVRLMILVS